MAIQSSLGTETIAASSTNETIDVQKDLAMLDASKLRINLADRLKPVPTPENVVFGKHMSDHMLVATYDPSSGWSEPEIKPYGPLLLDPTSSCFHYSTSLFEGMKAYSGPDGESRLFRPELNMARMVRSAERVALPPFDPNELLKLIKRLVQIESRWIPQESGYSLYIRPTIIGTRPYIGMGASDYATLFVVCCPAGLYFRRGAKMLSLMTLGAHVRAWPGGTGGHKISANYAATFLPQQVAAERGYDQVLWLLGDRITEAGAMNFFVVRKRSDGDLDLITAPLDGTVLPGVTRDSVLSLAGAHGHGITLPNLPPSLKIHVQECTFTTSDLSQWAEDGTLIEAFSAGTAVVIVSIGRIGLEGETDIILPKQESGMGPVAEAMCGMITAIQEGREQWSGWSVLCD
ncbi:hypothetical protein PHLCEN_2v10432 [Hermanssonia centrifuga]|uniref:Branched-chain-amino-acid aminotransferase n=1 Tax=Hermanssonia centrifuga TaxID=98765 RepID=A0A2R6NMY3_9APHY|nr:hypothetical protein PHLCEN_2v10432 [Hermanssonia centrifuga]